MSYESWSFLKSLVHLQETEVFNQIDFTGFTSPPPYSGLLPVTSWINPLQHPEEFLNKQNTEEQYGGFFLFLPS